MSSERIPCQNCGAMILSATAQATNGICMPCHRRQSPIQPVVQPLGLPHVYDKAKYHYHTIEEHDLPEEHACNHTVVILRWLIENRLMSDEFEHEESERLARFRARQISAHDIYDAWDRCLVDDMLSDPGNAFAMHYFDFAKGRYIHDYIAALQRGLPTEFHIKFTEDGYQTMKAIIDRAYSAWKHPKKPWQFWRKS